MKLRLAGYTVNVVFCRSVDSVYRTLQFQWATRLSYFSVTLDLGIKCHVFIFFQGDSVHICTANSTLAEYSWHPVDFFHSLVLSEQKLTLTLNILCTIFSVHSHGVNGESKNRSNPFPIIDTGAGNFSPLFLYTFSLRKRGTHIALHLMYYVIVLTVGVEDDDDEKENKFSKQYVFS